MVPETSATLWAFLDFGVCSLPGVFARQLLQRYRSDEETPGWGKRIAMGIASVMLAIMLAMAFSEIDRLKSMSRVVAVLSGWLAQDISTWALSQSGKGTIRKWIARALLGDYEGKKK